ncbi:MULTISPECIES: recombinase family protein [unclassified Lysobacter]|uniref:recombinase family protein n=1 Tax=unclassified Lysobacter TaxID=2635362 RepID=UPI001BEBA00A|nr:MULTISPECIES: recombinase family protein [unclassified Lysobacter]MBT2748382.1 recombinase family protein [Lysobacter sp. ISL-42]MBT2749851.1 recombinase family protein [Lysobacter sp. ISL-50]MBT2781179.1 recombinase family protein [Lysobacter sp. ISL-52]
MREMKDMRFAVYCYTPNQDTEELVFQRKLAEKAMAQMGASQSATLFVDQGHHCDRWDRPELQRLLHAVQQEHFDCVVISEWSELVASTADAHRLLAVFDPDHVVAINACVGTAMLVGSDQWR